MAVVTGGNRGIGLETCRALARAGLRVILSARDPRLGAEAAEALRGERLDLRTATLDMADPASIEAFAQGAGTVDVLVNNAGTYAGGGVLEGATADFREAMEVSFFGPLRLCQLLVPGMVARGYGRVVNVSSGYGAFAEGLEGPAAYSLAKAAMNALTFKLSSEIGGGAVKVNAVCPGWVRTRMGGPDADLDPAEAVDTIVWLATLPPSGPSGGLFRERRRVAW